MFLHNIVEHAIENVSVYNVVPRVVEAMVNKMTICAAKNFFELFVQTFVVLQTTRFSNSGLVTWLYNPLRSRE